MVVTKWFNEFFANAVPVIRQRGKDYYLDGSVIELKQTSEGIWDAKIKGSQVYKTRVEISKQHIVDWSCNCPYDGDVCKHVVATCYAILEHQEQQTNKPLQQAKAEESLHKIINSLSHDELKEELLKLITQSPSQRDDFILQYIDKVKEESKYASLVENICESSIDGVSLFDKCEKILVSAVTLLDQNKAAEAWEICQLLMENAIPLMAEFDSEQEEDDDYYGSHYDDWDEYPELFYEDCVLKIKSTILKIAPVADSNLQATIFNWCLEGLAEADLEYILEETLLHLAGYFVTGTSAEQKYLSLLETKISYSDDDQVTELTLERLLNFKIEYLKRFGREAEIWQTIEQYKHLDSFRLLLIEKYIEENRLADAKDLCNQSLNKPELASYRIIPFTEFLLSIAKLENDIAMQHRLTLSLFYLDNYNMKYFLDLKELYSPEEWLDASAEIEAQFIKKGSYYSDTLAKIYVENQHYHKILDLLKNQSNDADIFIRHGKYAALANEEDFIDCYQKFLRKKMQHTGRSIYEEVARHLHNLLSITQKPQLIINLVTEFKQQYPSRRAMIEIFDREFAKKGR